jgi:NTE family protein
MKYSYWKIVKNFFLRRFVPIADNTPLRHFLESKINFTNLPKSKMDVFIPAVNILTSELVFFDKKEIGVDHILASTAIPIIFPWQQIGENYYWDGGVMANTPILPLIQRDIRDIIIVILSPVGNIKLELPKNRKEAIERSFELSLIASFENFKSKIGYKKENSIQSIKSLSHTFLDILYGVGEFRFRIVSPNESLGVTSILNFSGEQAQRLIDMGYNDAKAQLSEE